MKICGSLPCHTHEVTLLTRSSREYLAGGQRPGQAGRLRRIGSALSNDDEEEYIRRDTLLDGS